jgi:hypothetical protein
MGDHTHQRGKWMLSYRFMSERMDDNYTGATKVTPTHVHADFMISPVSMKMDMHMLGVMDAPSDKLALFAMLNTLDISKVLNSAGNLRLNRQKSNQRENHFIPWLTSPSDFGDRPTGHMVGTTASRRPRLNHASPRRVP